MIEIVWQIWQHVFPPKLFHTFETLHWMIKIVQVLLITVYLEGLVFILKEWLNTASGPVNGEKGHREWKEDQFSLQNGQESKWQLYSSFKEQTGHDGHFSTSITWLSINCLLNHSVLLSICPHSPKISSDVVLAEQRVWHALISSPSHIPGVGQAPIVRLKGRNSGGRWGRGRSTTSH